MLTRSSVCALLILTALVSACGHEPIRPDQIKRFQQLTAEEKDAVNRQIILSYDHALMQHPRNVNPLAWDGGHPLSPEVECSDLPMEFTGMPQPDGSILKEFDEPITLTAKVCLDDIYLQTRSAKQLVSIYMTQRPLSLTTGGGTVRTLSIVGGYFRTFTITHDGSHRYMHALLLVPTMVRIY